MWCLVGLLVASSLTVPLILTLTVTGCGDKGEVRDGVPDDDEDEPAGPPCFKDVTKAAGVDWSCRNGEEFSHAAILEQQGSEASGQPRRGRLTR